MHIIIIYIILSYVIVSVIVSNWYLNSILYINIMKLILLPNNPYVWVNGVTAASNMLANINGKYYNMSTGLQHGIENNITGILEIEVNPEDFKFNPTFSFHEGLYFLMKITLDKKPAEFIVSCEDTACPDFTRCIKDYNNGTGGGRYCDIHFNDNKYYWLEMLQGGDFPVIRDKLYTPIYPDRFSKFGHSIVINDVVVNKVYLPYRPGENNKTSLQIYKMKDWYWTYIAPYNAVINYNPPSHFNNGQRKVFIIKKGETSVLGSTDDQSYGEAKYIDGNIVINDKELRKSSVEIPREVATLPKMVELVIVDTGDFYYKIWNEYYDVDGYKVRDPTVKAKRNKSHTTTNLSSSSTQAPPPPYSEICATERVEYIFPQPIVDDYQQPDRKVINNVDYPISLPLPTYIDNIWLNNDTSNNKIILNAMIDGAVRIITSVDGYVIPTIVKTPQIVNNNMVFRDIDQPQMRNRITQLFNE